jgi:hypothetical protein
MPRIEIIFFVQATCISQPALLSAFKSFEPKVAPTAAYVQHQLPVVFSQYNSFVEALANEPADPPLHRSRSLSFAAALPSLVIDRALTSISGSAATEADKVEVVDDDLSIDEEKNSGDTVLDAVHLLFCIEKYFLISFLLVFFRVLHRRNVVCSPGICCPV